MKSQKYLTYMEVWMNHRNLKLKLALSEISVKYFNFLKWNEQNIFVSGSVVGNVASHVSREEAFLRHVVMGYRAARSYQVRTNRVIVLSEKPSRYFFFKKSGRMDNATKLSSFVIYHSLVRLKRRNNQKTKKVGRLQKTFFRVFY